MALNQPTNVIPSLLSGLGNGTVDVTEGLSISWQVNGQSPMTAYQITVYANDATSTQLYSTGQKNLASPFYGTGPSGNIIRFDAPIISPGDLASAGISNGNPYKIIITQWWGAEDSISQTSASPFLARAMPTLTLSELPSTITTRDYTFSANYAQAQGDAVSWVRWQIQDSVGNTLLDTGNVYTPMIQTTYDGFFTGEAYSVQCTVETQNGIIVSTGWSNFSVSYPVQPPNGVLTVCQMGKQNAIGLEWSGVSTMVGTASGAYTLTNGELFLYSGSNVTWTEQNDLPIIFSPPWSLAWAGLVPSASSSPYVAVLGVLDTQIVLQDGEISVMQGGVTIASLSTGSATAAGTWRIVMTPDLLYAAKITETGGLYPGETLYPEADLYPQPSTGTSIQSWSQNISGGVVQYDISGVSLYGTQTCAYTWIVSGTMDEESVQSILNQADFEPEWDNNTLFLAGFSQGLNAGSLDTEGYAIYRRDNNEAALTHICDLPLSTLAAKDYGAASQESHEYYVFNKGANTYTSAPMVSNAFTPMFWMWSVLECYQDSSGVYHVITEYPFTLNVETGSVSNNNTPTLLQNFTPYPTRQISSSNYRSGTLQAYIGEAVNNQYVDTLALAQSIYALSISTNPKFLKLPRGEIIQIETKSAITMETNATQSVQAKYMSLPWVEIGDASNVSIVMTPQDSGWPVDNVVNTTVEIDLQSGNLIWNTPSPYLNGSSLSLNASGFLVQSYDAWFSPADMWVDGEQQLNAQNQS